MHGTPLQDEARTEVFECRRSGHPGDGSWTWSFVPAPPASAGATGLAAALGLPVELPAALSAYPGRWVEYGLVERAYARDHPADFGRLVEQYGPSHLAPTKYTTSANLARALGELSRTGTVLFRSGRGTGRWSYNSSISYWALPPEPNWDDRLTWEQAGAEIDYLP